MRILSVMAALGLVATANLPTPAMAKAGYRNWAQCAASQAPDSVTAWLAMPLPVWASNFTDSNVLLGHRLVALCDPTAIDPVKPNRMPSWKSLAAALRREAKTVPAPAVVPIDVLICESSISEDGKKSTYLYEIVRRSNGTETISFQQYYGQIQGQQVKLPQDLRMLPKEGTPVARTCRLIGPKGELTDA